MQLRFKVRCSHCGNDSVVVPDETDDTDVITCNGCHVALCTVDQLNARIRDASAEAAAEHLRNVLAGKVKKPPVIELKL